VSRKSKRAISLNEGLTQKEKRKKKSRRRKKDCLGRTSGEGVAQTVKGEREGKVAFRGKRSKGKRRKKTRARRSSCGQARETAVCEEKASWKWDLREGENR